MDDDNLLSADNLHERSESTTQELIERADQAIADQARLSSLLTASRQVMEGLALEDVLRHIAQAAVTLVDAQYGALGVVDLDGRLERFIHVGMAADVVERIGRLPEGRGMLGAVIESDSPIRVDDLTADPRSSGFPEHHPPMHAFLGVPIRIRGATFGNLYLTNRAGGPFTADDVDLVTALAATAAIAIDNARLYENLRHAQRLSSAMSAVNAALLAPEGSDVFGVLAEHVAALLEADLVAVVVHGSTEQTLHVAAARGLDAALVEGTDLPAMDSVIRHAVGGVPGIGSGSDGSASLRGTPFADGSLIAVPLVVSGRPVGALCARREPAQTPFTSPDLDTASEFAAQGGLAVALAWARADRQQIDLIEDRARIARDLHDNVIQRLFGTGLGLQALAAIAPRHAETIDGHVTEIDEAIADIRTAVFTLRTRSGLPTTRHRLLDIVTDLASTLASPPRVSFSGPVDLIVVDALADDVAAVVREALTNIARHAHAHTAAIDISVSDTRVTVTIDDDGDGVPPVITRTSGLHNLDARARSHGGTFALENRHPRGTRARWEVPVQPAGRS